MFEVPVAIRHYANGDKTYEVRFVSLSTGACYETNYSKQSPYSRYCLIPYIDRLRCSLMGDKQVIHVDKEQEKKFITSYSDEKVEYEILLCFYKDYALVSNPKGNVRVYNMTEFEILTRVETLYCVVEAVEGEENAYVFSGLTYNRVDANANKVKEVLSLVKRFIHRVRALGMERITDNAFATLNQAILRTGILKYFNVTTFDYVNVYRKIFDLLIENPINCCVTPTLQFHTRADENGQYGTHKWTPDTPVYEAIIFEPLTDIEYSSIGNCYFTRNTNKSYKNRIGVFFDESFNENVNMCVISCENSIVDIRISSGLQRQLKTLKIDSFGGEILDLSNMTDLCDEVDIIIWYSTKLRKLMLPPLKACKLNLWNNIYLTDIEAENTTFTKLTETDCYSLTKLCLPAQILQDEKAMPDVLSIDEQVLRIEVSGESVPEVLHWRTMFGDAAKCFDYKMISRGETCIYAKCDENGEIIEYDTECVDFGYGSQAHRVCDL